MIDYRSKEFVDKINNAKTRDQTLRILLHEYLVEYVFIHDCITDEIISCAKIVDIDPVVENSNEFYLCYGLNYDGRASRFLTFFEDDPIIDIDSFRYVQKVDRDTFVDYVTEKVNNKISELCY